MGALGAVVGDVLLRIALGLVERASKRADPVECARLRAQALARMTARAKAWRQDQDAELAILLGRKPD